MRGTCRDHRTGGAFLIVHGLLHLGVWATPEQPDKPATFDRGLSWALAAARVSTAPARAAALALAWYTGLGYVVAGAGVLADTGWWPTAALVAAASGFALNSIHPVTARTANDSQPRLAKASWGKALSAAAARNPGPITPAGVLRSGWCISLNRDRHSFKAPAARAP